MIKKIMSKILFIVVIGGCLWGSGLWAQENPENGDRIQSLADLGTNKDTKIGGYGGPWITATSIAGEWGVLVGGRGALLINRVFSLGMTGAGFAGRVNRSYLDDGGVSQSGTIGMGYGGIYLEYIWDLYRFVHFSIPVDFVAVGIGPKNKSCDNDCSSDVLALFAVIPRINVEFNVASFFIIGVNGGYRFAFGKENTYATPRDAWGPEIGLFFKFGGF